MMMMVMMMYFIWWCILYDDQTRSKAMRLLYARSKAMRLSAFQGGTLQSEDRTRNCHLSRNSYIFFHAAWTTRCWKHCEVKSLMALGDITNVKNIWWRQSFSLIKQQQLKKRFAPWGPLFHMFFPTRHVQAARGLRKGNKRNFGQRGNNHLHS